MIAQFARWRVDVAAECVQNKAMSASKIRPFAIFLSLMASLPGAQQAGEAPEAILKKGVAELRATQYAAADAAFRKLIEVEPAGIRGYLGVVQVYAAQKQQDEALQFLQQEAEKAPDRLDLRVAIGDVAELTKRFDLAVTEFRGVLGRLDGKSGSDLYVPLGSSFLTGRDATPKGAAGLHIRLAEALASKGDRAAALVEWRRAAEMLPQTAWVITRLAVELDTAGRKDEALRAYRAALPLDGSNPVVLNNLAFLIADGGGDLAEASRLAKRANLVSPGSPDIMDTMGWIAFQQGNVDDALGSLRRALQKNPDNPDFRKHLLNVLTGRAHRSPDEEELLKALKAGDQAKIISLLDRK